MSSRVVIPALPKTLWHAAPWLAAAAIAVVGANLQGNTYLNHDVAWVLYSAREMLGGAVFGRDILVANPPLTWYLVLPVVSLSQATGFHVADLFHVLVIALVWGELAMACLLLRRPEFALRGRTIALVALVAAYCFFVGSGRDFGQREYLATALCLPYLLLTALRLTGGSCGRGLAIAIGLSAGIGFAFKPYFLAVPLLVELYLLWRSRSLRRAFRAETWSLATVVILYAGSLPFLVPEYLWDLIPRVSRIYWGFQNTAPVVLMPLVPGLIGFLAALCLARRQRASGLPAVLLIAAGGFLFSYLVQFKGYSYHAFPFSVIVTLLLTLQVSELWARQAGESQSRPNLSRVVASGLLLLFLASSLQSTIGWYDRANRSNGSLAAQTAGLVALVDRWAGDGYFLAISTHPYPGFPTALYSGAKWASRSNSVFFLPAVAKLRQGAGKGGAEVLKFAEDNAQSLLLDDLARRPRVILVSAQERKHGLGELTFDLLDFYLENPEIRQAWADYREIESLSGYRIFVRRDVGGVS